MRLVHGVGINDCIGWCNPNHEGGRKNLEYRIYMVWAGMLARCYSENIHSHYPSYKDCTVCERWHTLSNFAKDIKNLVGYYLWKNNPHKQICLDKDITIPGNREYRPEACCFITREESSREVLLRRPEDIRTAKTIQATIEKCARKIICTFEDGREELLSSAMDAERKYGFNHSTIAQICLGKHRNTHHGCKFRYA